jgi:phage terminase large subunit
LLKFCKDNNLKIGKSCYENVVGQVFEHELKKLVAENRYCNIAHDPSNPVFTFWDIGSSDMTVILFVQFIGKEVRIIDIIKDNNKGLNDYYMPEVIKRKDDLGYRYAGHYLPHDSGKREWTNNTKIIDQARKVTNDVFQLPRDRLADGIQSTKAMFSNVWINKIKCNELYEDLVHYKREYDEDLGIYSDKPVHDKYSHSADAFRYVSYYKKPVKLDMSGFDQGATNPFTY